MAGRAYKTEAVVLRSLRFGEADRVLHLYTLERGRIGALAKGIRKTKSRFGARLEPTSHVSLQCYRGRELDVVTQVETIDANRALREHNGCLTHAISMLEAPRRWPARRNRKRMPGKTSPSWSNATGRRSLSTRRASSEV